MANRITDQAFSETTNGKHKRARAERPKAPTKVDREARESATRLRRRLAGAVGGVGVGVLGLSVWHVTEAVALLTGSPIVLAGLLAVGVDAGMVACEAAEIVAHDDVQVRRWARGYVGLAVALSVLLNGYAFSHHWPEGMGWAGWSLGAVVPGLVLALGRVAALLAREAGQ